MHRTQHRLLLTLTAGIAALALGAAPALAGSDGCDEGDCRDENAPARVVPVAPVPVAPQPLAGDDQAPEANLVPRTRHVVQRTRTVRAAQRAVPRGAVAAGAGGTAPHGPDGLLALLAGGGVVLVAAGGGLVASGRRTGS